VSAADGGDRNAVVAQICRSFVLQTPANHNSKLVLDSLGDVEVETISQTGSTNNLATETDINAISVAMPMFLGESFFNGVYTNLARRFLHPKTPKWRTDTGSSYNFVTENDINVISAVTT